MSILSNDVAAASPGILPHPMPRRPVSRHEPTLRLTELRTLLLADRAITLDDIQRRLTISHSTARRYLRTLSLTDAVVEQTLGDGRKAYHIERQRKLETLQVATGEMISIVLARAMLGVLQGTGIAEDLDEVATRLLLTLKKSDAELAKNLSRKVHDLGEARRRYDDKIDPMDDLVTGLVREEKVRIAHGRGGRVKELVFHPYTLVSYKRGLYFLGRSEAHDETRVFALDAIVRAERLRGERFAYPADHDPVAFFRGRFGLIGGADVTVRVRFAKEVAHYVERRAWHPTQTLETEPSGDVVLTMRVAGTTEVSSWILSFGGTAEVLEPPALRDEIRAELARGLARYG